MTTVTRLLELYNYDTTIKISPCVAYCVETTETWFGQADQLLYDNEDIFNKLYVEIIEHFSRYDVIYYSDRHR